MQQPNNPVDSSPIPEARTGQRAGALAISAGILSLAGTVGATVYNNLESKGTIPTAVSQLAVEGFDTLLGTDLVDTDIDVDVDFPGRFLYPDFSVKTSQPDGSVDSVESNGDSASSGQGTMETVFIPGETTTKKVPTPDTTEKVTTSRTDEREIAMEWARLFSKDPNADKLTSPEQVDTVVEQINALEISGQMITKIEVIGHASDEDDTPDTNPELGPGLGIDSPKNVELATLRGEVIRGMLQERLDTYTNNTGGNLPPVENSQGVEVQDPAEQAALELYASNNGLDGSDLSMLMKAYNRGADVPEEVRPLLDAIAADRYVLVKIYSEKTETVSVSNPDKIVVEVGEGHYESIIKPGTDTMDETTKTEEGIDVTEKEGEIDLTLMLLALPVGLGLIDLLRRRAASLRSAEPLIPVASGIVGKEPLDKLPVRTPVTPLIPVPPIFPPENPPEPPPVQPPVLPPVHQPENVARIRPPKSIGSATNGYGSAVERIKQPRQHNMNRNQVGGARRATLRGNRRGR